MKDVSKISLGKNAQNAADRFMAQLSNKEFTLSRSKNTGKNYDTVKQKRDSEAVAEFIKTEIFKDILKLK